MPQVIFHVGAKIAISVHLRSFAGSMSLLEDWEFTKAAALKGLERSGWSLDQCSVQLLEVLSSEADSAADLLSALAILSAWHRAGSRAEVSAEAQACGQPLPEVLPYCKPAAEEIWLLIRGFQFPIAELEKRWLVRCFRAGYVISPKLIEQVLSFGEIKKNAALQPLIALVAGNLGRWLAGFYPGWGYVVPEVLVERFKLGKTAERIAALTAYRIVQPAAARELLASTWPRESNADRLKLLEAFGARVLKEDESFLLGIREGLEKEGVAEGAVTRQLKQLVAKILLKNQSSATWSRWVAHLSRYWSDGLALPEVEDDCFNEAWISMHGISAKGSGALLILHWWSALLSLLPPSLWVAAFNTSPKSVLKALEEGPYSGFITKSQVHAALISSTRFYKDPIWAELLIGLAGVEDAFVLFELLSPEKREHFLMGNRALIARISWDSPVLQFDWTPAFSNWVLRNWYESLVAGDVKKSQVLMSMGIFLHPAARPATIPGPYDPVYLREEWFQKVAAPLEKIMAVKAML